MASSPDCTIIIPVGSDVGSAPRIALRLHAQRLSAKSVLLSGLFTGVSPIDLLRDLSASRLAIPLNVPRTHLPRLLPSPPSHPVLFLPVPDPSSIQSLFHWMYSGSTDHIESALDQRLIRWEGLARNVEYLCLSTDIKVFLGRWYRDYLLPPRRTPCLADDDEQSDLDSDYESPPSDGDQECDRGRTRDVRPLEQLCAKLRLCTP